MDWEICAIAPIKSASSCSPAALGSRGTGLAGNYLYRLDNILIHLKSVSNVLVILRPRTFPRINTTQFPAKPVPLLGGGRTRSRS